MAFDIVKFLPQKVCYCLEFDPGDYSVIKIMFLIQYTYSKHNEKNYHVISFNFY